MVIEPTERTLDIIAENIANADIIGKTEQITPAIMDVFLEHITEKDKNGVKWYNFNLSDKKKDALAEKTAEALVEHYYLRFSNYSKEEMEDRKMPRNPLQESEAEVMIKYYFKFDVDNFKTQLRKMSSVSFNRFMEFAEGMKNNLYKYIQNHFVEKVKSSFSVDEVKEWVKDKISKFQLDSVLLGEINKAETMDDALRLYVPIAQQHYKGIIHTLD